jgi:hypothetical protein
VPETIDESLWIARVADLRQHLADLRTDSYNGASARADRDAVFERAFELLTPLATRVLADLNHWLLQGTGVLAIERPHSDRQDGLLGSWELSWPELRGAVDRFDGGSLSPVRIGAIFPSGWTHGHLVAGLSIGSPMSGLAWPFQIADESQIPQYEPVVRVIAEGELHDRILRGRYGVIPGTEAIEER